MPNWSAPFHRRTLKGLSLFLICVCSSLAWGVQNKTYPTSATTQIRMDTYDDGFITVAKSTWTVQSSTWSLINGEYYWIEPVNIKIWRYDWKAKTSASIDMSIDAYTSLIIKDAQDRDTFTVADLEEQYSVWPDTYTAPSDWKGWCLQIINGREVPVACPQKP